MTLIGTSMAGPADDLPLQPQLPFESADGALLDGTLDEIRERFGTSAVTRGVLLGRTGDVETALLAH